jgi:sulfate permease, SulP family
LLVFLLVAAPLIGLIPLASLGAMLLVVAWSMTDKGDFWLLLREMRGDAVVLLATFLLTIFVNLIAGIAAGCAIAALLHWYRKRAKA